MNKLKFLAIFTIIKAMVIFKFDDSLNQIICQNKQFQKKTIDSKIVISTP